MHSTDLKLKNIVIDIGNTNVKICIFHHDEEALFFTFSSSQLNQFYKILEGINLKYGLISTVIPIPTHIKRYLKSKCSSFFELSPKIKLPFTLKYENQDTLGQDRIALTAAAQSLFPKNDVLIINCGSCVTYNLITKEAIFLGGAISPGLQMRLKAMNYFTAALPLPTISTAKPPLIAQNTEDSLLSGAINGLTFEIEGYIQKVKKEYTDLKVLLSGGESRYLEQFISLPLQIETELGLKGLQKILEINAEKNL